MKKIMRYTIAAAAGILLSGCTFLDAAPKFNGLPVSELAGNPPTVHLNVSMTGFYLFHFIPIATGSVGSVGKWAIFKDTVKVEHAVSVLTREARTQFDCTRIYDLQSRTSSSFVPLLYSFKTVEVSATAAKGK